MKNYNPLCPICNRETNFIFNEYECRSFINNLYDHTYILKINPCDSSIIKEEAYLMYLRIIYASKNYLIFGKSQFLFSIPFSNRNGDFKNILNKVKKLMIFS